MRGLATVVSAALFGVLPTCAFAWPDTMPTVEKVVRPGQTQKIAWFLALDPTCRSMGPMTINLIEPPAKGRIMIEEGLEYPAFATGNPRSACNKRKVTASRLIYSAPPGVADDDQFAVEIVGPLGSARRVRYHVELH